MSYSIVGPQYTPLRGHHLSLSLRPIKWNRNSGNPATCLLQPIAFETREET